MKDGVFHIILAGRVHNIVIQPSVVKAVFVQRTAISSNDFAYHVLENFFGDNGDLRRMDPHTVFSTMHAPVARLNREPFVSSAALKTVQLAEDRVQNLVSFNSSWVDQSLWERLANVSVDPKGQYVEADFFRLVQIFISDIASTALMGQDFMNNNPNILDDLFTVDAKFQKLLLGVPSWFPGMAPAYRARYKVRDAVRDLHQALYDTWDGKDPGSKYSDLSDVSNVIQDRARVFRESKATPEVGGIADGLILWAMNVNAPQVIFWLLWRIYQSPSFRDEIMSEFAPYATLTEVASDLPIQELPRLKLDLPGLVHECPLLKSTFYETMRIVASGPSYKCIVEPFSVTESAEDAALDGKSEPQTYQFNKGEYICIPHSAHTTDGRYWSDPEAFRPRRFITDDVEKKGEKEKPVVDMGSMKVFGGGVSACKGKNFIEREMAIFVAAILTTWDIEPVSGSWTHPGMFAGSGASLPKNNIRVRLRRRVKA